MRSSAIDQKKDASFFNREGTLILRSPNFSKQFDSSLSLEKIRKERYRKSKEVCPDKSFDQFFSPERKFINGLFLLKQFVDRGFSRSSQRDSLKESDREWGRLSGEAKGCQVGRSKVIICILGVEKKKVWPIDRFIDLARTLQDRLRSKIPHRSRPPGTGRPKAFETWTNAPFWPRGLASPAGIVMKWLVLYRK